MQRTTLAFIIFLISIFSLISIISVSGQNSTPASAFGIKLSGYIKTDAFYDTRQSSAANGIREGHFYLFPDDVAYDTDSNDINANPTFHILSIQTRFRADITAPQAFGAKTSGAVEAEFFGTNESDLNGFRLRHAFVKLDWDNSSLLIGQTWHPMFPTPCFPGTVSFNTGAPFTPFSRNPQIKYTQSAKNISATITAYSQRDFTSSGPDGSSNKYLRNSGLPGLNLQFRVPVTSSGFIIAGTDYKIIRPELQSVTKYENKNTLKSFSGFITANYKSKPITATFMGVYAQNASDLVMIGGYAVHNVSDTVRKISEYTNLNTFSGIMDLTTNGKKVQAGLFAGYSKNLGSSETISGKSFGRGLNVDYLFRISPRLLFTQEKLTFAAEVETTIAAYGKPDEYGKIQNSEPVTNIRFLLAVIYKF